MNRLNDDAREAITKRIPIEELILCHTMFPVARFIPSSRMSAALNAMAAQAGEAHNRLPVPKSRKTRF